MRMAEDIAFLPDNVSSEAELKNHLARVWTGRREQEKR
jgi:hypothetical protein